MELTGCWTPPSRGLESSSAAPRARNFRSTNEKSSIANRIDAGVCERLAGRGRVAKGRRDPRQIRRGHRGEGSLLKTAQPSSERHHRIQDDGYEGQNVGIHG